MRKFHKMFKYRAISSLTLTLRSLVMHNNNGCVALETNNGANNTKIERPYLYPHASRIIKRTDIILICAEYLPKFIPDGKKVRPIQKPEYNKGHLFFR